MDVFLANFSLFYHVPFMSIPTNNFPNFIEIMNWVFAIKVPIFGCKNRVVEEMFGRLLKIM